MITFESVQALLVDWGQFWDEKERGSGYGSNSITGKMCETLRTGIFSVGTAHMVSHTSDAINVPERLYLIDSAITRLTFNERKWLVAKYKKPFRGKEELKERVKFTNMFIAKAEHRLLGILN
jgi:hypothetical protein